MVTKSYLGVTSLAFDCLVNMLSPCRRLARSISDPGLWTHSGHFHNGWSISLGGIPHKQMAHMGAKHIEINHLISAEQHPVTMYYGDAYTNNNQDTDLNVSPSYPFVWTFAQMNYGIFNLPRLIEIRGDMWLLATGHSQSNQRSKFCQLFYIFTKLIWNWMSLNWQFDSSRHNRETSRQYSLTPCHVNPPPPPPPPPESSEI